MQPLQSPKQSANGERKELKFCEDRPMRFQSNLRGINKEGWQRWVCSRRPINPETGAYCSGCAWRPPGATQLKPRTPHDEWCRVKDDDEKLRRFSDTLHSAAAQDDTQPATNAVSQAKYGCSRDFKDKIERIAKHESLVRRINRRRNDGQPLLPGFRSRRLGSAMPMRTGRARENLKNTILYNLCDELDKLGRPMTSEERLSHLDAVHRVRHRHRRPIQVQAVREDELVDPPVEDEEDAVPAEDGEDALPTA